MKIVMLLEKNFLRAFINTLGFLMVFFIATPVIANASPKFFAATSAWNTPIPSGAVFSSSQIGVILYCGLDTWNDNEWTMPLYTATPNDGLHPILYNVSAWSKVYNGEWLRSGNTKSVESAILSTSKSSFPYPGNVYSSTSTNSWILPSDYNKTLNPKTIPAQIYLNSSMSPAKATDGHIAILQPNGLVFEAYSGIVLSTGQIVALSYSITNPNSRGDGWQNGQTASMLPSYAGLIYDDEISNGINHVMAVSLPATFLNATIAYPAYAFDRNASTASPPYSGSIPMGGRFAIPRTVSLSSLKLQTKQGQSIAKAAQTYGFIVVDRDGAGITLKVQPNAQTKDPLLHAWNSQLQADLLTIFRNVRRVNFPIPNTPH